MSLLPSQFHDLEPFAAVWALEKEHERRLQRMASTMEELQAFYHTLLPQMEAVMEYLHQFRLAEMPEEAKRLLYLTFALAEVAPAVEFYGQPEVIDGFPAERLVPDQDVQSRYSKSNSLPK